MSIRITRQAVSELDDFIGVPRKHSCFGHPALQVAMLGWFVKVDEEAIWITLALIKALLLRESLVQVIVNVAADGSQPDY